MQPCSTPQELRANISAGHNLSRSRNRRVTLFLLPYLLGAFILILLPAGISFFTAFQQYNGVAKPEFIGWGNFRFLFTEPLVKTALFNSLTYIAWAVPLRLLGALALALLYNRPRMGMSLYRGAVYLPTVIPVAAFALTWTWILNPLYGPLNASLRTLGLPAPPWLADSAWAFRAIVLVSLFQIGEAFIVLLAALRNIPATYYDAARVDGANRWQMFASITFPFITPWLVILAVYDVVLSFQNTFTPAYLMTRGGPYYATFFTPLLIYETAFDRLLFGPAAGMMLLVFVYTILMVAVVYLLFNGWGFDEE